MNTSVNRNENFDSKSFKLCVSFGQQQNRSMCYHVQFGSSATEGVHIPL